MTAPAPEIRLAEPAMLPDIAALHAGYYGGTPAAKLAEFEARFLAPDAPAFASERSFIVVALERGAVVGTTTYTDWPVRDDARTYASVQSGQTLVEARHRGTGLFARILEAGQRAAHDRGVDFLMGFPHARTYPGVMRGGWTRLGALRWRLRPLHPLRVMRRRGDASAAPPFEFGEAHRADPAILLDPRFERAFAAGRLRMPPAREARPVRPSAARSSRLLFSDDPAAPDVVVVARLRMTHGFAELVLGDVRARVGAAPAAVGRALAALVADARRSRVVDAVSLLASPAPRAMHRAALRRLFLWTPETVPFVVKAVRSPPDARHLGDLRAWSLMFSDIDTW